MQNYLRISGLIAMMLMLSEIKADNIYIMNAAGYNTAQPELIAAMELLGHTVTVNTIDFTSLPPGFTSHIIDPVNGYHWLCFFGDFDFAYLAPEVSGFIANGGEVYYNYEVSCCTTSSSGAAAMVSAVTGLPVTPSSVEYVGLSGAGGIGWQCEIPCCFTITGNAYKPFDGLPLANQLIATFIPPDASPDLTFGANFGFYFSGNDIPGNTLNGSLTGMGDINMWYDGAEPTAGAAVNMSLVAYIFLNDTTTCHLSVSGCETLCPFENVLGPDASICENADLTLDATSATATGYLWYDNSTNPTKLINQPGIYWVEVTDGTETCRDSIEVTEVIVVVDAGPDDITCPGFTVDLLASGADTYLWQPAATLNFADIPNPQASPVVTTTYTVTGTADGCSDTDEVIVSIDPIDVTYNVVITPQICETNGSLMIENVAGSSANYILEINNAVVNEDEVYSLVAGVYQLQITDDNGCQAIEDITLPLNNGNISWTSSLLNPRCERPGAIVVDNIQGGTEPYEYKLNNNLQPDPNFENLSFGDFDVKITDQNGCSTTMNYTLENLPNGIVSTVNTIDAICETPGRLTHVDFVNALSPVYLELDNVQYFNDDIPIDTNQHILRVVDADGCAVADTFQIVSNNFTQAIFTADPYIAKAPVDVTFTNTSLNATSYSWDFGNGKFSENVNDQMQYLEPGDYNVVLTAMDDVNGCIDTMLFIIYVGAPNTIYVPNTFTPDNDGINDVFMIKGQNISLDNFSFSVFNRWGDPVWTSVDPSDVWTGSYQGGGYFLPDGVYPFLLKYQYTDSSDRLTMSGHVQIIR